MGLVEWIAQAEGISVKLQGLKLKGVLQQVCAGCSVFYWIYSVQVIEPDEETASKCFSLKSAVSDTVTTLTWRLLDDSVFPLCSSLTSFFVGLLTPGRFVFFLHGLWRRRKWKKKKNDISETAWHSQGETLIHRPYSKPSLSLFSKLSFFISLRWEEWEEGTSDKRAENGLFKQP